MPIVLLTDFGTRDPYVAAMKGVIASRTREPIVDASHEIAPFDVVGAAWFVNAMARYWPAGTVCVCVVDPGVGTKRRIVALEKAGRVFLAPDNGLLTFLLPADAMVAVENASWFLPDGSTTFHGRDRFAPVAAAIANGTPLTEFGPPVESIETLPYEPPAYGESLVRGTIVAVDRFGNAVTDVEARRIPFAPFALTVHDVFIDRLETTYGDAAPGPFLIVGSNGTIEISVANAAAAERLGLRRLDRVVLTPLGRQ